MKATRGNFFEDFHKGQIFRHPTPRTLGDGDAAAYLALYGDRRPLHCAAPVATGLGLARETLHDLLVFHTVFGKTVGQVSLNAVANLGYADGRWLRPVFAGETLRAESEVLGTKEVSSGKAGIVWVRTRGLAVATGDEVLRYCRWVMVEKRDPAQATGAADSPELPKFVPAADLIAPALDARGLAGFVDACGGGGARWDDYTVGERIDHMDGMTVDEADHTLATRLYQNTARVHFNLHAMTGSRFGKRLVYGGHVISIAWGLAMNGLASCLGILALNGGAHANPTFAGDTIYAWTEILDKQPLAGRSDAGALRIKLCAVKNVDPSREPLPAGDARQVLELDLWVWLPR